ncbi:uncharacterized protein LOC118449639 [Vespa mandarinia]|uniref:uncharacterized protein LOC118449639 n=1 Tax=Vespa mandarinia TaxID=7446 RepID=UPI00161130D7|nr:uncharacterized protein LOC118449639 [Vespa mandarinia]
MRAVEEVILYRSVVWAEALRHKKYRRHIAAEYRKDAHRNACSYSKISDHAVQVVAGVIPIDLLTHERLFVHQQRPVLEKEEASRIARSTSIETWQSRWEQEPRGRWTSRLISRLDTWLNLEAGDVDFFLTQFLIGHARSSRNNRGSCKDDYPPLPEAPCSETARHSGGIILNIWKNKAPKN